MALNGKLLPIENILDSNNNNRFTSGSFATFSSMTAITFFYRKWSLNGKTLTILIMG